MEKVEEIKDLL